MLIRLAGGRVVDPVSGRDAVGDVYIEDGRIVAAPPAGARVDESHDVTGRIVMAGAIDIHSHVAGGNVTLSRLLLPELHENTEAAAPGLPFTTARWSAAETGRLYARMGFTTVVEPAVPPSQALQSHLELADMPVIDKATLSVLGNEDFLLSMLRAGESEAAIADYVALMLSRTRALGLKVINAGGSAAFRDNVRTFGFDDEVPYYGVSSRRIVKALQKAVTSLGVRHPLHVHCNNLGVPGTAIDTLVETIDAAEGLPLHLAHVQFYAYGTEGKRGFSSAVPRLVEALKRNPSVTIDVGQVMFGQTVTISADVLRQFAGRVSANPNKWILWDGDGNGAGVVPFAYNASSFVNALQWAIGLEIFLSVEDPWRVFFTTDHPNGAPFTTYPKLLHLLMSADERARYMAGLPKAAMKMTALPSLTREYSFAEIAIMTRAAPAKLLGLDDRGHLGPGALADIAVYDDREDRTVMFEAAHLVFKNGRLAVKDGELLSAEAGQAQVVAFDQDAGMVRRLDDYLASYFGADGSIYTVRDEVVGPADPFKVHPCRT